MTRLRPCPPNRRNAAVKALAQLLSFLLTLGLILTIALSVFAWTMVLPVVGLLYTFGALV